MTTTLSTIPGLANVKKVEGFYQGWAWATEIQHSDFRPILAHFGDYRVKLEDSDLTVHLPVRELQIEFCEDNGEQSIEFTALIDEYISGQGLQDFSEFTQMEADVRDFFTKLFEEAE